MQAGHRLHHSMRMECTVEDNHKSKSVSVLPALRSPSLYFSCVDTLETELCIVFITFLLAVKDDSDNGIYRAMKK